MEVANRRLNQPKSPEKKQPSYALLNIKKQT